MLNLLHSLMMFMKAYRHCKNDSVAVFIIEDFESGMPSVVCAVAKGRAGWDLRDILFSKAATMEER